MATNRRVVIHPTTNVAELDTILTGPAYRTLLWNDGSTTNPSTAAYSVRLVNTEYTGPCIRVRRTSDNALADIGFASGVLDQTALLAHVGTGGTDQGYVHTWYDQYSNQFHYSQPSNSWQPKIVTNGAVLMENGKPAISNDGTDNIQLKCPIMYILQPATYFLVGRTAVIKNYAHYMDGFQVGARQLIGTNGTTLCIHAGTTLNDTVTTKSTAQELVFALFNGANSKISTNNSTGATGNANTQAMGESVLFSGRYVNPNYYSINGSIQELQIFALSDETANRTAIEADINSYFSVY
jgi:hypothetical protein